MAGSGSSGDDSAACLMDEGHAAVRFALDCGSVCVYSEVAWVVTD